MPHVPDSVLIMHQNVDHSNVFLQATGERDGPHNEYGAAAIPQSSYPINPIYEGDLMLTLTSMCYPTSAQVQADQQLGTMHNTLCHTFCCLLMID